MTTAGAQSLDRLEGEARTFASSQHVRLSQLAEPDLELWVDMAEHISRQRLRDKRAFFNVSLDGLRALSDHPELRPEVHEWAHRFTKRSSRLASRRHEP